MQADARVECEFAVIVYRFATRCHHSGGIYNAFPAEMDIICVASCFFSNILRTADRLWLLLLLNMAGWLACCDVIVGGSIQSGGDSSTVFTPSVTMSRVHVNCYVEDP
eukprot:scaffold37372_cov23-Cyclotella_meneghiniana.AAC.1